MTETEKKGKKNSEPDIHDPSCYANRELSWIAFDERCLYEARDEENPLFERLKFLSITASNLDEFFMVRVASLKDMVNAGYKKRDIAGMTAGEQLEAVENKLHSFIEEQYSTWNDNLLPELRTEGLVFVKNDEDMSEEEKDFADRYFDEFVYPVLTPMAVDSSRPFPLIRNKTINIGALVTKKGGDGEIEFATVQVPGVINRVIEFPYSGTERRFMLLEDMILRGMPKLFLNYDIVCCGAYRVGRNADLSIDEDEAEDLLKEIEKQLKLRQWGKAIRLEVVKDIDDRLLRHIQGELEVADSEIYRIDGPLDLTFLMKLYSLPGFEGYKESRYVSGQPVPALMELDQQDIFAKIREGDILMHHPYETFDPVVRFVERAAMDDSVLAIKQTLYRVSGNSPIIAALERAAERGKQVSVLVELKARFDEEHNIVWAKRLEHAGCHVIYGLVGLKTHCKITLVVRREEDQIRRYVHLGTGNYNDSTAKLYTDVGLFTCAEDFGEDATAVFNMLSGYSEPLVWNKLALAPIWLKDRVLSLIRRETANAAMGLPARIIAKMNSLCHEEVIAALYEASRKGVKIDLIVRGICCLRAGIPGVSENITVCSIVGNFLEHSRIFYFENAGKPELYLSSADWMPRNLERRVEIMFPVEKEMGKEKLIHILKTELEDTEKTRILEPDDTYRSIRSDAVARIDSQRIFGDEAAAAAVKKDSEKTRVFEPMTSPGV